MMARFDGIKVGDKVVITPASRAQCRYVANVERVTRTQFVADGIRFSKAGSQVGGDGWHFALVDPATPDLLAAVALETRRHKALSGLRRLCHELETVAHGICRSALQDDSIEPLETAVADLEATVANLREVQA